MLQTSRVFSARPVSIGLIAVLLIAFVLPSANAKKYLLPTGKHGQGELRYMSGLPIAILTGTPQEIGEQHAALMSRPAAPLSKFSKKMFTASGADELWPMAVLMSKRLLQQAPKRYRQEMNAATTYAKLDSDEIAVSNTLLELRRMGCSTLIVEPSRSATGGPLFGRNFDFPALGLLDKYSLVTIVRPTDGLHSFATIGYPGLFGVVSGMNDVGLAIATLDVYESGNGSTKFEPTGVPLMFVFRQILEECTTVAEAEQLLKRTKATTWANLAVCDRDGGAVFEITPTEIARRDAKDSILPCTNHFRAKGLAINTECWRFDQLLGAAEKNKLDVEAVHRHLHEANQGELTLHTMIFEPRELALHLALGTPPSSALPLQRLDLRELLAPQK